VKLYSFLEDAVVLRGEKILGVLWDRGKGSGSAAVKGMVTNCCVIIAEPSATLCRSVASDPKVSEQTAVSPPGR
jgi:hypothetical protein